MTTGAAPVTVSVTRVPKAGREREFEAALHDFIVATIDGAGQLGVQVLRPAPGDPSRRYTITRRFEDVSTRDAFYSSEAYADWERRVTPLTEGDVDWKEACGLEAWFTAPGRAIVPPPRWKMASVTLLGVYPLSLLLPRLLKPLIGGWPQPLVSLVIAACMVASLTWLVMPSLSRLLHGWLHPSKEIRS